MLTNNGSLGSWLGCTLIGAVRSRGAVINVVGLCGCAHWSVVAGQRPLGCPVPNSVPLAAVLTSAICYITLQLRLATQKFVTALLLCALMHIAGRDPGTAISELSDQLRRSAATPLLPHTADALSAAQCRGKSLPD